MTLLLPFIAVAAGLAAALCFLDHARRDAAAYAGYVVAHADDRAADLIEAPAAAPSATVCDERDYLIRASRIWHDAGDYAQARRLAFLASQIEG